MIKENLLEASLIIPTYNNADTIRRTIKAFREQTIPREQFELIIIDDGSTDHPETVIADYIADGTVRFLKNDKNRGSAFTRNRGLDLARGRLIIFADGDTIPCAEFVEEHFKFHQNFPGEEYAALGNLHSPADMEVTPLMHLGNAVENWNNLEPMNQSNSWVNFRTGNFSMKRSFLGDLRFNEKTFAASGFEDTELGFRLARKGMKILYHEPALAYHYHFRSPQQYMNKVVNYGRSLARWVKQCDPEVAKQLNAQYNYLIDRDHLFNWQNGKEMIRRICINDLTAPMIIFLARSFEKIDEKISVFFYNKLYKFLFLKGYRKGMAHTDDPTTNDPQ